MKQVGVVPSTPGSSATKRRKSDDDDLNGNASKKQRTRVSFSCGECHRRKQKCNREIPCSHCLSRKVPELCKAYTPGKNDQDLSQRLLRLEQIIEMALPQYCSPGSPHSSFDQTMNPERRSRSLPEEDSNEEQLPNSGTFHSGKWYGNSASGSVAPSSVLEQLQNMVNTGREEQDQEPLHSSSSSAILDAEPSAADNLKSLIIECGVSPHKISELLQELPPPRFSAMLIDFYFASINFTRYPVSEIDFRVGYNSVSANLTNLTNPTDVRFLPLLFVVLAIAVRLSPDSMGGNVRNRRISSLRYYWASRRSLLIAAAIQPDSLDIVLTRLLSARFLTFDRRITECWSQLGAAVRTAQALGLHRDGSTMHGLEAGQIEYRRRIWSYLYHADRSYALVLGRPNAIQDDYTSTQIPMNIDDDLLHSPPRPDSAPPLSHPSPMTFVILRHTLAAIMGRMVHHFQQVRTTSHYSEVIALDDELLRFVSTLPPHFSLEPDTSLDETAKYIPVHRFLLITEILFVRISLHRPYLLRRLGSDRYLRSRTACFESAMKDYQVREAFRQATPHETRNSLSNAYREFQTALISGMYLVIEGPRGRDATTMHSILDGFIQEHEGLLEMDETTRRELKTIEFLKKKASQIESSSSLSGKRAHPSPTMMNATASNVNANEHSAQLLLGLHQGTSPHMQAILREQKHLASTPHSPTLAYPHASPRSPTFQRVQRTDPYGSPDSASPGADDEAAQSLLNHWCNTVSNGPSGMDNSLAASGWPPGDYADSWNSSAIPATDSNSDYTYWEALVNHIRVP